MFYLAAAANNEGSARRLGKLSRNRIARGKLRESLRLRVRRDLHTIIGQIASSTEGVNKSDLVRGAILAAKQDILDGGAPARQRKLEAVAQAV